MTPKQEKEEDKQDELLLDVLKQACRNEYGEIDNQEIPVYVDVCDYLTKKGMLEEVNSRIYNIVDMTYSQNKSD